MSSNNYNYNYNSIFRRVPTDITHITDLLEVRPGIRESIGRILEFSKADENSYTIGVPSYMRSSTYMDNDDDYSQRSKDDMLHDLWFLFLGPSTTHMNKVFRKKVRSPHLNDQLDSIIGLYPVYSVEEAKQQGKFFNNTTVHWIGVTREDTSLQHIARDSMGPRLPDTTERTEYRETIVPIGATFTLKYDFLDSEEGQKEYLQKLETTINGVRYAWVRQILSVLVTIGKEGFHRRVTADLPVSREELHTKLIALNEQKFTLVKDHYMALEGFEKRIQLTSMSVCGKRPDYLLMDPEIPINALFYQHSSRNLDGIPDTVRRDQSLQPIENVISNKTYTYPERMERLCAPPIPDLYAEMIFNALRTTTVVGDFIVWEEDTDVIGNGKPYYSSLRSIVIEDGDKGCLETIPIEKPLHFAGLFLDGKMTFMGAGVLRSIISYQNREYRPPYVSDGTIHSESIYYENNPDRPWYELENVIGPDVSEDRNANIWENIAQAFRSQDMEALDTKIEYDNIPEILNLYNLFENATLLDVAKRLICQLSRSEVETLRNIHLQYGNVNVRAYGKSDSKHGAPREPFGTGKSAYMWTEMKVQTENKRFVHIPTHSNGFTPINLHYPNYEHFDNKRFTYNSVTDDPTIQTKIKKQMQILGFASQNPNLYVESLWGYVQSKRNNNIMGNETQKTLEFFNDKRFLEAMHILFWGDTKKPADVDEAIYKMSIVSFIWQDKPLDAGNFQVYLQNPDLKFVVDAEFSDPVYMKDSNTGIWAKLFLGIWLSWDDIKFVRHDGNRTPAGLINLLCQTIFQHQDAFYPEEVKAIRQRLHKLMFSHQQNDPDVLGLLRSMLAKYNLDETNLWDALRTELIPEEDDTYVDMMVKRKKFLLNMLKYKMSPHVLGAGGGGSLDVDAKCMSTYTGEDILDILKEVRITHDSLLWLIRHNIPLPLKFIGVRLDNRWESASVLAGIKNTGVWTLMKELNITTSLHQENNQLCFSSNVQLCVVPESPEYITYEPEVYPISYYHGAGTKFFLTNYATRQAYIQNSLPPKAYQIIALAVPYTWTADSQVLDVRGYCSSDLQKQDPNTPLDYPTAPYYSVFWGGWGVHPNFHILSLENIRNPQRTTTTFRQYYKRKNADGMYIEVDGATPLGYKVTATNYRVSKGLERQGGNLIGNHPRYRT